MQQRLWPRLSGVYAAMGSRKGCLAKECDNGRVTTRVAHIGTAGRAFRGAAAVNAPAERRNAVTVGHVKGWELRFCCRVAPGFGMRLRPGRARGAEKHGHCKDEQCENGPKMT